MGQVYSRIGKQVSRRTDRRAAVFLDRDGVIVEDTEYLHRVEDVRFIPGALTAIAAINQLHLPVVLVTNQAGIGRGYYSWRDFEAVEEYVESRLARCGGWLDAVWACAYSPNGAADHPASYYRKPNPGMLEEAAARLGLDLKHSWLAGDKPCDIQAGIHAGLGHTVHLATGWGCRTRAEVARLLHNQPSSCKTHFCESLADMLPILRATLSEIAQPHE